MFEFTELEWSKKSLRGKEFGTRSNAFVYLKGRGPHVIRCRTGSKPEESVRLAVGGSMIGFGPKIDPVFSELNSEDSLNFGNMYLSADGIDPQPPRDFVTGAPEPRENAAMKPETDYYLTIPRIEGGHSSWVPQVKVSYVSTSSDDVSDVPTEMRVGISLVLDHVPGTWYPNETI